MKEQEFRKQLGAAIREARKAKELTPAYMAYMLNVRQSMYYQIEEGTRSTTVYKMAMIITVLGIKLPDVYPEPVEAPECAKMLGKLSLGKREPWPERNNI